MSFQLRNCQTARTLFPFYQAELGRMERECALSEEDKRLVFEKFDGDVSAY